MSSTPDPTTALAAARAAELVATLGLQAHPEGGHYGEVFRSTLPVRTADGRPARVALTTIDFLLQPGQFSAWHRVASDEVWHLLEGPALRLWLAPPDLSAFSAVELGPVNATRRPRHVVPAGWWQAAEPVAGFAYVGATVGPGFEFADFSFGREDAAFRAALQALQPALARLLKRLAAALPLPPPRPVPPVPPASLSLRPAPGRCPSPALPAAAGGRCPRGACAPPPRPAAR